MGVVVYPLARFLPLARFSLFLSARVGFAAYRVALYLLRAIDPEEWRPARSGLFARIRRGSAA